MAKTQTRRSISVKGLTYLRLKRHCDANGISVSGFLEEIIRDRLDEAGAPIPIRLTPLEPSVSPKPHVSPKPPIPMTEPSKTTKPVSFDEEFNEVFGGKIEGTGRTTGDHEPWK